MGMDGVGGIVVRAAVVVSDARFCRLLLLGWDTDLRSVSSRARFWLFSMLEDGFFVDSKIDESQLRMLDD